MGDIYQLPGLPYRIKLTGCGGCVENTFEMVGKMDDGGVVVRDLVGVGRLRFAFKGAKCVSCPCYRDSFISSCLR